MGQTDEELRSSEILHFLRAFVREASLLHATVIRQVERTLKEDEVFTVSQLERLLEAQAGMMIAGWIQLGLRQNRSPREVLLGCRGSAMETLCDRWPDSPMGIADRRERWDACSRFLKKTQRFV